MILTKKNGKFNRKAIVKSLFTFLYLHCRLKNWIASQGEREQEALDRKQKKLERLCYQPKHKFEDAEYDKLRSQLPEKVSDAVEEGFKAAASTVNNTNVVLKRKADNNKTNATKNKKKKLWYAFY